MSAPTLIAQEASGRDPVKGLRAVSAMRRLADQLEIAHVTRARQLGWTWQQIADELGTTRQAVHKKHGRKRG